MGKDKINWNVKTTIRKFTEDISEYRDGREQEFYAKFVPFEEKKSKGNLLVNGGINKIWDLVTDEATVGAFDTGSHIGIGDSATGAAATQTDLQAASNKKYNPMEATYPLSTLQKATFRSSFADGDANFQWNEWGVFNASGSAGGDEWMMNRKVEDLGTKTGGTWQLTVEITLS